MDYVVKYKNKYLKLKQLGGVETSCIKFYDTANIKDNIIYLNIKPIYKSEVFLNQSQILSELRKIFGKKTNPNIGGNGL